MVLLKSYDYGPIIPITLPYQHINPFTILLIAFSHGAVGKIDTRIFSLNIISILSLNIVRDELHISVSMAGLRLLFMMRLKLKFIMSYEH